MSEEYYQISSKGDRSASNRCYTAEVSQDQELQTTCISLSSIDQSNSSRNILLCIAPEYGSNLYRFRVGEYDLIYYTGQAEIQRSFTAWSLIDPGTTRGQSLEQTQSASLPTSMRTLKVLTIQHTPSLAA